MTFQNSDINISNMTKKRGRPKKETTEETKAIPLKMPKSLYLTTRTYAAATETSFQDITNDALRAYFETPEHKEKIESLQEFIQKLNEDEV